MLVIGVDAHSLAHNLLEGVIGRIDQQFNEETAMSDQSSLLLVLELTRDLPERLIDRAAFVARKLRLHVIAYCPTVTPIAAGAMPAMERSSSAEALDVAQRRADEVARVLRSQGIAAHGYADSCAGALEGTLEIATRSQVSMVMASSGTYVDWASFALSDGKRLERLPVPLWVENDAPRDGIVLGALEIPPDEADVSTLDKRVATHARQIADGLGTDAHFVHCIPPTPAMERAIELLAMPNEVVDAGAQQIDDRSVAHAHRIARECRVPPEHVHIHDADLVDSFREVTASMTVCLVVMGGSNRSTLARMLSESMQQQLLDAASADLLIVDRSPH